MFSFFLKINTFSCCEVWFYAYWHFHDIKTSKKCIKSYSKTSILISVIYYFNRNLITKKTLKITVRLNKNRLTTLLSKIIESI